MRSNFSIKTAITLGFIAASAASAVGAHAADFSDTYISYRYGTHFAEPFNNNAIAKNIVGITHSSTYKYGSNFFAADFLLSDDKDPLRKGSTDGAQDAYAFYRHTLDWEKVTGVPVKFGPVRGAGLITGLDFQSKNDAGYNSSKRMFSLGPSVQFDVPGYLNVSVLMLWESNAPFSSFTNVQTPRYHYKVHPMLGASWGIPLGNSPVMFEGYVNLIAPKGKNEFNRDTVTETTIDLRLMYDLAAVTGGRKNAYKVGFEYQYWKNKFGNDHNGTPGSGAFARTPMIRAEFHF